MTELQKKNYKIAALFFFLYFFAFSLMLFPHFSLDTFDFYAHNGYEGDLINGRAAAYIINLLFLGTDIYQMSWLMTVLAVIFLTLSSVIIYSKIEQASGKNSLIIAAAVAILFCNTFMADVFQFNSGCHNMTLGILFASMALKQNLSLKNLCASAVLLFIGLSFYQAVLGYYVAMSLVLIYFSHDCNLTLESVKDSLKIIFVACAASLACFLELRFLQITEIVYASPRTGAITFNILIQNLRQIYGLLIEKILPTANTTYPQYILPIFLFVIYAVLLYSMIKKRAKSRDYVYSALIILVSTAAVFAPHIFTTSIWTSQRSIFSFWSILTIPVLFIEHWRGDSLKKLLYGIAILILSVNIVCMVNMQASLLSSNKIDQEISYLIQSRIDEYEHQTGNKIKTIAFRNDNDPTWAYKSIDYSGYDFAVRSYTPSWGAGVSLIEYFNNRSYERRPMTNAEYNEFFQRKNWNIFSLDEQLVFFRDTLYMVSY